MRAFAKAATQRQLEEVIGGTYGLTWRGKSISIAGISALRALQPFIFDRTCRDAFVQADKYNPELREHSFLMKIGFACSPAGRATHAKAKDDAVHAKAKDDFAFVMNALRTARLTGDIPKDQKLTVLQLFGRAKDSPGMVHALLKKKELVEYISHEAFLIDNTMQSTMDVFKTPLSIMQKFATSGAHGLVALHRSSCESVPGPAGMAALFQTDVAEYRSLMDAKAKAMIDVVWPLWAGDFDDEIAELARQDAQNSSPGFLWHMYLNDETSSTQVGTKYRAFMALCIGEPAAPDGADGGPNQSGAHPPDELQKLQEQLKKLRRRTVKFISLPDVGAASGAEYANSQLLKAWEQLSLGHHFAHQEGHVRAFVASAELFPPNVTKQGVKVRMSEEMQSEGNKFMRVVEFCTSRRGKDDILVLCDGRSRDNRRCIETLEKKMGNHPLVECWCVYVQPSKRVDPRAPARQTTYSINNKEMAYCNRFASPASPKKGMFRCHRRGQWSWLPSSPLPPSPWSRVRAVEKREYPRTSYFGRIGGPGRGRANPPQACQI